jgi:hypothetical protein
MTSEQDSGAWQIRAARNQALFRAVNEELERVGDVDDSSQLTIACECADRDCVETIAIDLKHYADVRRRPTHFIVLPGHVYSDVEDVVEKTSQFVVVEKRGRAAAVAEASA